MIGYGPNRGVIPIVCDEIFKKIANNKDITKSFEVMISMLEIYNETVRDLLQKNKKK
jgi:kinesin family protein 1